MYLQLIARNWLPSYLFLFCTLTDIFYLFSLRFIRNFYFRYWQAKVITSLNQRIEILLKLPKQGCQSPQSYIKNCYHNFFTLNLFIRLHSKWTKSPKSITIYYSMHEGNKKSPVTMKISSYNKRGNVFIRCVDVVDRFIDVAIYVRTNLTGNACPSE